MNTSVRSLSFVVALCLASTLEIAAAQNIGMPPGARQWIHLNGNWVHDGLCCDDAIGVTGTMPDPSPNYVGDTGTLSAGGRVFANGDTTANRLRSSYTDRLCIGVFLYNSQLDTYTITGPAGSAGTPVNARLIVHEAGTIFVGTTNPLQGGLHVGGSFAQLEAGTWDPGTDPAFNEQFRVIPFDTTNFFKSASIPIQNYGNSSAAQPIDLLIDQVLVRTVGTPFDLAVGLTTTGDGAGNTAEVPSPADDGYLVATIDWELPAGYSITSVLGWSDPTVVSYCTAGTSGSGCTANLSATGIASATSTHGFVVSTSQIEGDKDGLFFFGSSGPAALPWGTTSSFLCVNPPLQRCTLLNGVGTPGACDGAFAQDLNALWCPTCPRPSLNPGAGAVVELQLWYRDPPNPKTTSLSDALQFTVAP